MATSHAGRRPGGPDPARDGSDEITIIGGGPAGLTAAYELLRHGLRSTVLEGAIRDVGGLARTVERNGYRFDIGPHRFFSKNREIEDLWTAILGGDMLSCSRLTRIRYRNRFIPYPLKPASAVLSLGPLEAARCLLSYARARVHPIADPETFEEWVTNEFGSRLFSVFFKTYTEKVWGVSTRDLSADWAQQRIKRFNLGAAIKSALLPTSRDAEVITTLIDEFRYPRLGPGQLWERMAHLIVEGGSHVILDRTVVGVLHGSGYVRGLLASDSSGAVHEVRCTKCISSMPLRDLIRCLRPAPPDDVLRAAEALQYRDLLLVGVVINRPDLFADNWIYIHDPGIRVGRIQNLKNWSPEMVPDPRTTSLILEYFCSKQDDLWRAPDAELVALAGSELAALGICDSSDVAWGTVIRESKAYPVYDHTYRSHLATIRQFLAHSLKNLHVVGRNGMHHYNNQDHSMMTALLVARNIATGSCHDPWLVNNDAEYHEEMRVGGELGSGRAAPIVG